MQPFQHLYMHSAFMLYKLTLLLLLCAFAYCSGRKDNTSNGSPNTAVTTTKSAATQQRAHTCASRLLSYARQHHYATDYAFLIDMNLHSGSNRFFVYSFSQKEIIQQGLVAHGNCGEAFLTGRRYGNTPGCNCTSLGKYKIGNRYYGRFGVAYKLHGLDSTNNNAFKRFVVLHAHGCVPDAEVSPLPICQSNGCPTVSPAFLNTLATYIHNSKKPMLLWIYE